MLRDSTPRRGARLYRVCWSSVVGTCGGRGRPLPRDVAEFVAHDEALGNPLRSYWVEEWTYLDGDADREQVTHQPRPS